MAFLGFGRVRRYTATVELAPLPPGDMVKELEVTVSPLSGRRSVIVTMSWVSPPMTAIVRGISGTNAKLKPKPKRDI